MDKNPYVVGDTVRLKVELKDSYSEVWHKEGDIEVVNSIAPDGLGLMFASNLGTHFKNVELVKKAPRCESCGQVLPVE